jgi:hypothetical protein
MERKALLSAQSDARFIELRTQRGVGSVGKHQAKMGVSGPDGGRGGKGYCREMREKATWTPGFKGVVSSLGSHEIGPDYIKRFRVKDGSRYVSQKAWVRRKP